MQVQKPAMSEYWNSFYQNTMRSSARRVPSQFAAFACGEFSDVGAILEFGCGSGRDADFFGSVGYEVLAVDASTAAVENCQQHNSRANVSYVQCAASSIGNTVRDYVCTRQVAVYARFFLHAITQEDQDAVLTFVRNACGAGTRIALEYRTVEDAQTEKRFGEHYRRYIHHEGLLVDLETKGFQVVYEVKGKGFAKYGPEDAFVGRCVALLR
jgi:tellurite methyltransferase